MIQVAKNITDNLSGYYKLLIFSVLLLPPILGRAIFGILGLNDTA